jgi:hypothetical protein
VITAAASQAAGPATNLRETSLTRAVPAPDRRRLRR